MASSSSDGDVDVMEQQHQLMLIEQEREDREFAERLFREQFDTPSPPSRQRPGPSRDSRLSTAPLREMATMAPRRGRNRNTSPLPRSFLGPSPNARLASEVFSARGSTSARRGQNGNSRQSRNSTLTSAVATTSSSRGNSGGPIRRAGAPRRARGGTIPPRGRPSRRNVTASNRPQVQFNGTQVQVREGSNVTDVTAAAYFPDSEDDSDYVQSDAEDNEQDHMILISSSSSDSEPDEEPARNNARANGRRQPTINGDYIRRLLNPNLLRDNQRTDPLYQAARIVSDDEDDEDDEFGDDEDDNDPDNWFDDEDSDDDIIIINGMGPLRAEQNHIRQPIFEEDRGMYNRELDLYQDEDEYQVPPANVPKHKGKPIEPDSTWGDCTMCSSPPIKPQGCKKCLQFLGCADCVRRWHSARLSSYEKPSCPLCRATWNNHSPGVQLMPTIEKHRLKANKIKQSASAPSTSAGTSSAS